MNWYKKAYKYGIENKKDIKTLVENLKISISKMFNLSLPETEKKLIKIHEERINAVPDLIKYPELKGMQERIIEENRGIMDSVSLTYGEIAILRNYRYITNIVSPGPIYKGNDCTLVYFADSSDGPIIGNNIDDWKERIWQRIPKEPLIVKKNLKFWWGNVSAGIFYDEIPPEKFPLENRIFEVMEEHCENLKAAVEFLIRYKFFWGGQNAMIIEKKTKEGVIIEKSSCRYGIRKMENGTLYTTAMSFADPKMKEYLAGRRMERIIKKGEKWNESIEAEYWDGCDKRYENLARLVKEKSKNPSLKSIIEILQNHSPFPDCICLHGQGRTNIELDHTNYTIASIITLPMRKKQIIWTCSEKKFACQSEPVWREIVEK